MPGTTTSKPDPAIADRLTYETDHADMSVLDEPTIPPPGDYPPLDATWACHITIEAVDAAAREWIKAREHFNSFCQSIGYKISKAPPTDIQIAKAIIRLLEQDGLAPPKACRSWHAIGSLCKSDWIFDRLAEHGIKADRGEYDNRVKGE